MGLHTHAALSFGSPGLAVAVEPQNGQRFGKTIRDNVASARRARGDSGEVEQHTLREQLAVDRYRKGKGLFTARIGR